MKPNQTTKPKFQVLAMELPNLKVKQAKTIETIRPIYKTKKKQSPLEQKYADVPKLDKNAVILTAENSVQEFINHSHPDIRTFIAENKVSKYIAKAGELVIIFANKFRLTIKVVSKYCMQYTIIGLNKQVLLKDASACIFPPKHTRPSLK